MDFGSRVVPVTMGGGQVGSSAGNFEDESDGLIRRTAAHLQRGSGQATHSKCKTTIAKLSRPRLREIGGPAAPYGDAGVGGGLLCVANGPVPGGTRSNSNDGSGGGSDEAQGSVR